MSIWGEEALAGLTKMALKPVISEPHAARTRIGRREMREGFMTFSKETGGNC